MGRFHRADKKFGLCRDVSREGRLSDNGSCGYVVATFSTDRQCVFQVRPPGQAAAPRGPACPRAGPPGAPWAAPCPAVGRPTAAGRPLVGASDRPPPLGGSLAPSSYRVPPRRRPPPRPPEDLPPVVPLVVQAPNHPTPAGRRHVQRRGGAAPIRASPSRRPGGQRSRAEPPPRPRTRGRPWRPPVLRRAPGPPAPPRPRSAQHLTGNLPPAEPAGGLEGRAGGMPRGS